MSAFARIADVAQKGAVLGLFSVFGYQIYQISQKTSEYSQLQKESRSSQHEQIMSEINKKVQEESTPYTIDKIPDRYDKEDDSYLKKTPKLSELAAAARRS
jgi:predicted negative regulator of RcsB-dependent stress response